MLARFSIFQRTAAGFGAVIVVLLGLALFAGDSITSMGARFEEFEVETRRNAAMDQVQDLITRMGVAGLRYEATHDPADVTRVADNAQAAVEALDANGRLLAGLDGAQDMRQDIVDYAAGFADLHAANLRAETALHEVQAARDQGLTAADSLIAQARAKVAWSPSAQSAANAGSEIARDLLIAFGELTAFQLSASPSTRETALQELSRAQAIAAQAADLATQSDLAPVGEEIEAALARMVDQAQLVIEATETRAALRRDRLAMLSARIFATIDAMKSSVADQQARLGDLAEEERDAGMSAVILGAALATLVAAAVALAVGRSTSRDIGRMSAAMRRLSEGDLSIEIEGAQHRHEIGAMARALAVFRDAQRALKQAEEEKIRAQEEARRHRAAMMTELREGVGEVVDAAVAGDFGRRVQARFEDKELQALAEGVNRLLGSVQTGLDAARKTMAEVASGDLTASMRGDFAGAFAELKRDVDATVARLRALVEEIRGGSGEISRLTAEMARDAADLSGRAEGQAASLEETAATMEEMTATIRGNAENARSATELSRQASRSATAGSEVVGGTVEIIERIEAASSRIADITSVIDSIAFQTNLLALNAAVEAARAGEAGKGFAVVAAEVRQLAQRSADAASDIKGLIEDSVRQVSDGVTSAKQAGASLQEIVDLVSRLERTIADISSASGEQSSGVEEIASAVASLEQATQRNAAMAQDAARRTTEMNRTAETLAGRVAEFDTGGARARRAA